MLKIGLILHFALLGFLNPERLDTHSKVLFEVGRSKDQNKIYYEVNLDGSGDLNIQNPFKIYWKKDKRVEPLSYIQQKYAYGLSIDQIGKEDIQFHFVSYPNRQLRLVKMDKLKDYKVFIYHQNDWVVLNKVFIQIDGGSFWFPRVTSVDLSLTEPKSCKLLKENIIPLRK